jgi:hypothetical protein
MAKIMAVPLSVNEPQQWDTSATIKYPICTRRTSGVGQFGPPLPQMKCGTTRVVTGTVKTADSGLHDAPPYSATAHVCVCVQCFTHEFYSHCFLGGDN